MGRKSRFRMIEMAEIVFRGVFGAPLIENCQHVVFERDRIGTFGHNIIVVEYVAEEMTVIEIFDDWELTASGSCSNQSASFR